jgi:hypothetical protein
MDAPSSASVADTGRRQVGVGFLPRREQRGSLQILLGHLNQVSVASGGNPFRRL